MLDLITKKQKSALSHQHRTFNRLIKTIKDLQIQQEKTSHDLDQALDYYLSNIKPDIDVLRQHGQEKIKLLYEFYKNSQGIPKKELALFKKWLASGVLQFCKPIDIHEISDEIKSIFKELHGFDYQDAYIEEFNAMRDNLQKDMQASGMDVDFSDISFEAKQSEIMQKVFMKIGKAVEQNKNMHKEMPKSKKQIERELKKKQFEEMQSKSLGAIYKQLVRLLHPDLEQDFDQKIKKEEVMKKLTTAFKNNDLYSLLAIQIEWMNQSQDDNQSKNDEELKMMNSILKEQIKDLEMGIDMMIKNPRYMAIRDYYFNKFDGLFSLKIQHAILKKQIVETKTMNQELRLPGNKMYKDIIEQIKMQELQRQNAVNNCTCGNC